MFSTNTNNYAEAYLLVSKWETGFFKLSVVKGTIFRIYGSTFHNISRWQIFEILKGCIPSGKRRAGRNIHFTIKKEWKQCSLFFSRKDNRKNTNKLKSFSKKQFPIFPSHPEAPTSSSTRNTNVSIIEAHLSPRLKFLFFFQHLGRENDPVAGIVDEEEPRHELSARWNRGVAAAYPEGCRTRKWPWLYLLSFVKERGRGERERERERGRGGRRQGIAHARTRAAIHIRGRGGVSHVRREYRSPGWI